MNILFWNIRGNAIAELVSQCAVEQDADIICIAEHRGVSPDWLSGVLGGRYRWVNDKGGCDVIRLFAKDTVTMHDHSERDRYVVCALVCEDVKYVLAATHLPDRRNYPSPELRCRIIRKMLDEVRSCQDEFSCNSAIVIGDLNANPFDPELTNLDTLNATMFSDVIRRLPKRVSDGAEYPLMYNPVLRALGEGACGSYYMVDGLPPIYWHCLDQVVVSGCLVGKVARVSYLKEVSGVSLVGKAGPDKKISDHLPLAVTIGGIQDE